MHMHVIKWLVTSSDVFFEVTALFLKQFLFSLFQQKNSPIYWYLKFFMLNWFKGESNTLQLETEESVRIFFFLY